MPTAIKPLKEIKVLKAMKNRAPGYETRGCGDCRGEGFVAECGNGPHDRPETVTCTRCEGRGEASVFVYASSRSGTERTRASAARAV